MTGVRLREVVPEERPLVERLWQLYRHDLSEFRGTLPDAEGRYPLHRLPGFFAEDPDRRAYLVLSGPSVVGFTLVRALTERPASIAEFFVVRAVRRQGVGHRAAEELLVRAHPGPWQIAFQEENPGAARFWRQVASDVAGTGWREERRPVPGKPHLPPDTWLLLDTTPR